MATTDARESLVLFIPRAMEALHNLLSPVDANRRRHRSVLSRQYFQFYAPSCPTTLFTCVLQMCSDAFSVDSVQEIFSYLLSLTVRPLLTQ